MSLSQSVTIINEYTVKTPGGGSRGATIGRFITDYLCRAEATEAISSIQNPDLDLIPVPKKHRRRKERTSGVAFGNGQVSLSGERVTALGQQFQSYFDNDKTILKTVVSFDEKYLREQGLLDDTFVFQDAGDYRGHVDQLKLRKGLIHALEHIGKQYYDDLRFVGAVHVNTNHVHCHLAMVDAGQGTIMKDGKQRGKLLSRCMDSFRRKLDNYLDQKKHIKTLSASVAMNRQTAVCYVKNLTYRAMYEQRFVQMVMSALPENKNLWRAGTNRKEMRRPNQMVRNYVDRLLDRPDSGYQDVLESIKQYADSRQAREGLSASAYQKLLQKGRQELIDKCVNGVYDMFKRIDQKDLKKPSPFMRMLSISCESASVSIKNNLFENFCFKARKYGGRLAYHKKQYQAIQKERQEYRLLSRTVVSDDSKPLIRFLDFEQRYQAMCVAKYQYLFPDLLDQEIYLEIDDLQAYERKLDQLKAMREDKMMLKMHEDTAERYGFLVYQQHGGSLLLVHPERIDRRILDMQGVYAKKQDVLRDKLLSRGYLYDSDRHQVVKGSRYAYEDVKLLDLHHMTGDISKDKVLDPSAIQPFLSLAKQRYELLLPAKEYLLYSGQADKVRFLPESDIYLMKDVADRISYTNVLQAKQSDHEIEGQTSKTIKLDRRLPDDMDLVIRSVITTTTNGLEL